MNFATQAESSGFQMQIAEAAMKIDTAFLHARRAADDLDRYAQERRLMDLTARPACAWTRRWRRSIAERRSRSSSPRTGPRAWPTATACSVSEDVHTASHHAITEWQINLEVYGKALLGIEPNITHLI